MKIYIFIIIFIFCIHRINCDYEYCDHILDYCSNIYCIFTYYSHYDSNILLKCGPRVVVEEIPINDMFGGNYTAQLIYEFLHNYHK